MKHMFRRIISCILIVTVLFTIAPTVFAYDELTPGESMIDFSASDYSFKESDSVVNVTLKRHGGNASGAHITFKAADFISTYGEDYVILDENGDPFEKVYGEKPEMSELVYEEDTGYPTEMPISDDDDTTDEAVLSDGEAAEPQDTDEPVDEEADDNSYTKARVSTGSELLDAQAAYLNLPVTNEENEKVESETKEVLENMYNYFLAAEGALGTLYFEPGETEKNIRVKLIDNNKAEKNKLFIIALMSSDNEEVKIATSSTTYVSIKDDEPYEKPFVELADEGLVLTNDVPAGEITINRTEGIDYFSTVYVSTVNTDADYEDYKNLDTQAVAFVPGETQKKVSVEAYDFSKNSSFGVRLESDGSTDIGNHYIKVIIKDSNESESNKAQLMDATATVSDENAEPITLGTPSVSYYHDTLPGGWNNDINASKSKGKSSRDNKDLYLYPKSGSGRGWTTNEKHNLAGITGINYYILIANKADPTVYFEIDSERKWSGSDHGDKYVNPTRDWENHTLDVSKYNESYYMQFSAYYAETWLGNPLTFRYAKYNIVSKDSFENFNRKAYDFIEGSPNVYDIYYDDYGSMPQTRVYNPGPVVIKSGGKDVKSFYSNATESITIEALNAEDNEKKGIYLKEIRIAEESLSENKIYDKDAGKYLNDNVYVLKADPVTHKVIFTPDYDFVHALLKAGVFKSNKSEDSNLVIYPVYEHETVDIHFENADNNGIFTNTDKGSYINNIFSLEHESSEQASFNNTYAQYYKITVPVNSVIRVQMTSLSDRAPNGFIYWPHNNKGDVQTNHYKKGETIHTGGNETGRAPIEETDFSKVEFVAKTSMTVKPVTGEQTFYVGYSPLAYDMKPVEDLKGLVYDTNGTYDEETDTYTGDKTDENGQMWLTDPYLGKSYTINAMPPEDYYVSWKNMTGDTNNNGAIGDDGDIYSDKDLITANPDEILGNVLPVTLDQNNTRYQYYFAPKSVSATVTRGGRIVREKRTLFDIQKNGLNIKNVETEPVVGAYVSIGGSTVMTDGNGEYTAEINLPSPWGYIGASIMADGIQYSKAISIVNQLSEIRLSALEMFELAGLSAGYISDDLSASQKRQYPSDQNGIDVMNNELTITVKVKDITAIEATDAKFFIYDKYGYPKIDCSEEEGYNAEIKRSGSTLTATIRFNPKKDIVLGDRVYVQFADQNSKWYTPIDTGYTFIVPLDLDEFALPLIGSETLEDLRYSGFVVDVLGDPLSDMDLGTITGFETPESVLYTPALIPENEKADYTWYMSDYSYGTNLPFGSFSSTNSDKSYEKNMGEYLYKVRTKDFNGKAPKQSKFKSKSRFSWNITPEVGFNLRLSLRGEQYYFEDLAFCVNVSFGIEAKQKFQLPLGFGIVIKFGLGGNVAGIYHMYTDYEDVYETEGAVLYDVENFGMFKDIPGVRREGYLFLDPYIHVEGRFKFTIVSVGLYADFKSDMDFRFTEYGSDAYGDIYINLDFKVTVLGFTVHESDIVDGTFKLFNTEDQNGHFDYDTSEFMPTLMSMASESLSEGEFSTDRAVSRDYLAARSEWNSGEEEFAALADVSVSSSTTETELLSGVPELTYMDTVKLENGNVFMVFIDDDAERSAKNYGRLMWTVYDGNGWAKPQAVYDDKTFDAFPELVCLDGNRVMVAWSTVGKVLDEDAQLQEALEALEIQTAIFDLSGETPVMEGEVQTLTKPDGYADVLPKLTYMENTNQVVLYYTKMEFDDITPETVQNITDANSTIMYLVYDGNSNTWCNSGDSYSDDELDGMDETQKAEFREKWYGQRFLYLRLGDDISNMPSIMEIDAASFNGEYSAISWVVDWDKDRETVYDRDIFMQIYNTNTHEVTELIKISNESMYYSTPQFAYAGNDLYIFYGQTGENDENGSIRYHNLSDIFRNNEYSMTSAQGRDYYELRYTEPESTYTDREGNTVTIAKQEIVLDGDIAVSTSGSNEFDVYADELGRLFIFRAENKEEKSSIYMNMCATSDIEVAETNGEWSDDFEVISSENECYSEVKGAIFNGNIILKATKTQNGTSNNKLVFVKHTPYKNVEISDVHLNVTNPKSNQPVTVTADITNNGIMTHNDPVNVTFTLNGETVATETLNHNIYGSQTHKISTVVTVPEDLENAEFGAFIEGQAPVTVKPECKADVSFNSEEIIRIEDGRYAYKATVSNEGNIPSGEIIINAGSNDESVANFKLSPIMPGETSVVKVPLEIEDHMYKITNGKGIVDISVRADLSDKTNLTLFNSSCIKQFDIDAVKLISALTDIEFENNGVFNLQVNEKQNIQPEFKNTDGLRVMWLESSNENAVKIVNNIIVAENKGKSTVKGVIVPDKNIYYFDSTANSYEISVLEGIPDNLIKEVEIQVKVGSDSNGGSKAPTSSGSNTPSDTTPAPSDDSVTETTNQDDGSVVTIVTKKDGTTAKTIKSADGTVTSEIRLGEGIQKAVVTIPYENADVNTVAIVTDENGKEKIISTTLASDDTVTVTLHENVTIRLEKRYTEFTDTIGHWSEENIAFVASRGIFNGTGEKTFEPDSQLTRGMLAVVLHNFESKPEHEYNGSFSDVKADDWYADAVGWLSSEGIVKGFEDGNFKPDDNITREQFATILYRYANSPDCSGFEYDFKDSDSISDYAKEAICFANKNGIITGKEANILDPQGFTTRAEASAMIRRFITYISLN